MDLYCCWCILLFSKLYLGLKIILQLDWAGKNKKKLPKNNEIFADFALRIRNRFKLRKRSESERILKIAKRKRSEVKSILCEAKRSEFASLRTFSQSCEFALRIWSPAWRTKNKSFWTSQRFWRLRQASGEKLLMHDRRGGSHGLESGFKPFGKLGSGGARELRRSKFGEILTNSVKIFKIRVKYFAPNDFLLT